MYCFYGFNLKEYEVKSLCIHPAYFKNYPGNGIQGYPNNRRPSSVDL
ncbi:hypothetical protein M8C21_007698, partial [Ambrosia artemisiifolia]